MKKLVYLLFGVSLFGNAAKAQTATFTTYSGTADTTKLYSAAILDVTVNNPLRAVSGNVFIKTTIQSVSVPTGVVPQFCDNLTCNTSMMPGDVLYSSAYTPTPAGDYHAGFHGMDQAPSGSVARITVKAWDSVGNYSRTLTFIAYKSGLGVVSTRVAENDDVVVYPNPTSRENVNVLYSENAGVKKIAIYNLIGKAMQTYIPMDSKSAMLDIDNIPAGVYFIRLMDGQGHVVATRRFTRQ